MMIGIVWSHSRLPRWDSVPDYFHHLSLINDMGSDTVGVYFLITGYLFFLNYTQEIYVNKLSTRFKSLVIPYVIWNTMGCILWYIVIELSGKQYVSDNYRYGDFLKIVGNILTCEYSILWYVGVIIIYAIAAPFFYYLVRNKRIGIMAIGLFFILGISFHHPFSSPLLWMSIYTLGALLGVHYKKFMYEAQSSILTEISLILYPLCFYLNYINDTMLTMNLRAWTAIFFYIGIYDICNRFIHFKSYKVCSYSFFLFASHYLPLHILQRFAIFHLETELACWISYIIVPVIVILLCVSFGYYLDKKHHGVYNLLAGGR